MHGWNSAAKLKGVCLATKILHKEPVHCERASGPESGSSLVVDRSTREGKGKTVLARTGIANTSGLLHRREDTCGNVVPAHFGCNDVADPGFHFQAVVLMGGRDLTSGNYPTKRALLGVALASA